jgi:primase-polymerase (primpol)-like protein
MFRKIITENCDNGKLLQFIQIPQALRERPQWVVWRATPRPNGEAAKRPYSAHNGRLASVTDPATWGIFQEAQAAFERGGYSGIGFVFTESDPFTGIDLDDCFGESGELSQEALAIVEALDSYAELSPSGRGLHIIVEAELPPGGNRRGGIEAYGAARYFTFTGQRLEGTPIEPQPRQEALEAFHAAYIASPSPTPTVTPTDPLAAPGSALQGTLSLSDRELVELASNAANGERFSSLWRGDWSGYESNSEADLALASLLAFWTGGNAAQIDGLFRQSGLYRPKWERPSKGSSYGQRTIARALAGCSNYYSPPRQVAQALEQNEQLANATDWKALARDSYRRAQAVRDRGREAKGSSAAMLQTVFRAMLAIAKEAGETVVSASCRQLAERAGIGHETAARALWHLVAAGMLERESPHDGLNGASYRLSAAMLQGGTLELKHGGGVERDKPTVFMASVPQHNIAASPPEKASILDEIAAMDAFAYGARLDENRVTWGKGAALLLDALHRRGPLKIGEVAKLAGIHRITAGAKLAELATFGIVTAIEAGTAKVFELAHDWRERLEVLAQAFSTYGRGALRSLQHLGDRFRNLWYIATRKRNHHPEKIRERARETLAKYRQAEQELLESGSELGAIPRQIDRARGWFGRLQDTLNIGSKHQAGEAT